MHQFIKQLKTIKHVAVDAALSTDQNAMLLSDKVLDNHKINTYTNGKDKKNGHCNDQK
jgi:hypothetical protein